MSVRIAILASGRGSNFEAIADAVRAKSIDAEIACVLSDVEDAGVLERAVNRGVEAVCVPRKKFKTREEHEAAVLKNLQARSVQFVVLAGYMRILSQSFITAWDSGKGYSKIVNIHPSLLPSFPGKDAYPQAFDAGVKVTGVTVHLVNLEVDQGPVLAQEAFSIEDCVTVDEVTRKGLAIEHRLYPRALRWVLAEEFQLEGRRVRCLSA